MDRRDFLKSTAVLGAASMLGLDFESAAAPIPGGSMLDLPASSAPVDTIVVCMMENRSFDHYLGWLGTDEAYLEAGRSRYGGNFRVIADNQRRYADANGAEVPTFRLATDPAFSNPYRGCDFVDPGHSWTKARVQRRQGFLAQGSGNDRYALGYFDAADLPFYSDLARRFTVLDRYHCSVLGPTFPNREYLHSAQSGGVKDNSFPPSIGYPDGFTWPTIWDRLLAAGVSCRYYYSDLPVTLLWGGRLNGIAQPIANYFTDAAAGQLPNVVFIDPKFLGDLRTDEHPHGDVRDGARFVFNALDALVQSSHWGRSMFVLTYDEWGGFFDHVRPPRLRDDRRSADEQEDFSRAGFRVPTRLVSPWARPGYVDHTLYDHTSILRFIEWRFLGAPARGPGRPGDHWFLTRRDRYANNIGASLLPANPSPDVDLVPVPGPDPASPACGAELARASVPMHDLGQMLHNGYAERVGFRYTENRVVV
jgi:phospholipase C